jgi:molybdopterin/thiamine biosynthesis adenylyltransferase
MKRDNLKIAVIGLNGIGSYFVRGLSELIKKDISGLDRINVMGVDLWDFDTIEEKNFSYTIYDVEHIGRNKAEVLAEMTGYKARPEKIERTDQLADYDLIVMAVDNNEVRNLVYQAGKRFLDLRAKGKGIMAYLTQKDDTEYLELTADTGEKGGCQYEQDIEDKTIELGNRIVAEIGLQYLVDYLRGDIEKKKTILMI